MSDLVDIRQISCGMQSGRDLESFRPISHDALLLCGAVHSSQCVSCVSRMLTINLDDIL